jgi:hypothetical protein
MGLTQIYKEKPQIFTDRGKGFFIAEAPGTQNIRREAV